jgi:hypothetical protein
MIVDTMVTLRRSEEVEVATTSDMGCPVLSNHGEQDAKVEPRPKHAMILIATNEVCIDASWAKSWLYPV